MGTLPECVVEELHNRSVIGTAIGLVMARYGLDQETAKRYLVRLSNDTNTRLRVIADTVIAEHESAHSPHHDDDRSHAASGLARE